MVVNAKFYLVKDMPRSRELSVPVYWRPDRDGYTSSIHEAGIYGPEDAQAIRRAAGPDRAWLVPVDRDVLADMRRSARDHVASCEKKLEDAKREHAAGIEDADRAITRIRAAERKLGRR